jgi:PST family polysaccharide transporter
MGYIIPLITLPYLVRVLGPDKFGLVMFAKAFIAYFVLFTEYGFRLSATREISINKKNIDKVSEIFCSVYIIKLILFLVSLIIFLLLISFIPRFSSEYLLYVFTFIMVLGNLIFPVWLFQGMQQMKYITIINVIVKFLFIIPIFVFINHQADYIYVPLINSGAYLVSGIIALFSALFIFKIRIVYSFQSVLDQFKKGYYLFVSTLFHSLYSNSNVFLLGLISSNEMVGYYSSAEKLVTAFRDILSPISQATYPHLSRLFDNSKEIGLRVLKKIGFLLSLFALSISLSLLIFAPLIVRLILGEQFYPSVSVIRIMAILPFIMSLTNIFGTQGLLAFGRSKIISKIVVIASLFHILVFVVLTKTFSISGSALAVVLTESLVAILCFGYLRKYIITKSIKA